MHAICSMFTVYGQERDFHSYELNLRLRNFVRCQTGIGQLKKVIVTENN